MQRRWRFAALGLLVLGLAAAQAEAQGLCIVGVSKDLCEGALSGGQWAPFQCSGPQDMKCSTLTGTKVGFGSPVKPGAAFCDEAKGLDGNLRTDIKVNVRLQPPLIGEGSFAGTFTLVQGGSILAQGSINATLGVGTHRIACSGQCGKDCETCYDDASFNLSAQAWTIGTEGLLDGQVIAGPFKGCHIRWSMQGRFNAKGDAKGPTPPGAEWKFCGNVDGVLECPCG